MDFLSHLLHDPNLATVVGGVTTPPWTVGLKKPSATTAIKRIILPEPAEQRGKARGQQESSASQSNRERPSGCGQSNRTRASRTLTFPCSGSAVPITVVLEINKKKLTMEVDTGAAVYIISNETRKKLFPEVNLTTASVTLRTYTG